MTTTDHKELSPPTHTKDDQPTQTMDSLDAPLTKEDQPVKAMDSLGTPLTEKNQPLEDIPEVLPHTSHKPHLVWLLPIIAVLIGGWLAYKTITEKGPYITINFQTANGLVAGKTRIKYKSVDVGLVESIQLSDNFSEVLVSARMTRSSEPHLRKNTKFWVVRPRLSTRGVSGLDTLVAGAHIELDPGQGAATRKFKGLETPQVVRIDAPGKKYILQAEALGSLDAGSPLYYRGIPAGEVLGYTLADGGRNVKVHLFIRAPYHTLVQENTRFWRIGGVDFSLHTDGVDVKTESLQSLWMGGIAFDTPETLKKYSTIRDGLLFWLYENKAAIAEQAYTKKMLFVLYFDESVRGLSVDASVEFRGIKVGKVTEIRMEYDPESTTFRIPVLVQIEPERINDISGKQSGTEASYYTLLDALVQRGLRAQLQTSSYLTGQRFVELDMYPDAPLHLRGFSDKFPELPTIPGSIGEITVSITHLLKKLQAMPLNGIAQELHGMLKGANQTVNAPELREAIISVRNASVKLEKTLVRFDEHVALLSDRVGGTTDATQQTLAQTEKTLAAVEYLIQPNAPLHYNLVEVIKELSATARTLRSFIELLETRPESLFFGKEKQR